MLLKPAKFTGEKKIDSKWLCFFLGGGGRYEEERVALMPIELGLSSWSPYKSGQSQIVNNFKVLFL